LLLCLIPTIAIGTVTNARAQTWQIGSNYSVQFSCNQASGIFKDIKANILFDEQNPDNAKFNVNVDAGSLNTGNALMNKHAKSDEWLDAAKYPAITFASKKITKNGASYQVTGDLTLHGVTKEVSIPFAFKGVAILQALQPTSISSGVTSILENLAATSTKISNSIYLFQ
jgi:polyisoprenoid-binding protein YceI